jgi:hypothetical protein
MEFTGTATTVLINPGNDDPTNGDVPVTIDLSRG